MPRKRKVKPREQKIAEEFFPVDIDDVKMATEKIVKPMPPTTIIEAVKKTVETAEKEAEKIMKKVRKPRQKKEKKEIIKATRKEFSPQKITLRPGSYELIITEKPQAAMKIANALGEAVGKNLR